MIEAMATLRISEADLARDLHSVLAKVQEGVDVIVEQERRAVAVIKRDAKPVCALLDSLPREHGEDDIVLSSIGLYRAKRAEQAQHGGIMFTAIPVAPFTLGFEKEY
jgi:hypothetical protein